jgi:hypothetical protein
MERHVNPVGMTAKSLIYRVINDLLREVIRPGGVGVHPGPFTHWLQSGQYFNCIGVILAHG